MDNSESLLHYPCDFVLKVFGHVNDEFESTVLTMLRQHVADLRADAIRSRPSKDGKYLALSITLTVTSKEQLDNIYKDLSSNPQVIMAL